ncbi:MAG: Gfo/Idh/MocA family oxidoreductase [Chloroflexales bacterium]|nr:Gfo/Idh/MocA family oxidoreductase [Chloroflexales bacterium]
MRKPRIGFVGVGSMGQCAHLRNYASLAECEVAAIAEVRPQLAAAVAQRYGVPRVYASAEAMLEREQLDGLVAIQPFDHHGQVVLPLYAAGIPVLTEKPLASSIALGERLLAALREGGSWHMVGYHKRSDPATMVAKAATLRFVASGELGTMRYVRITMPEGDWVAGGFADRITSDEPVPPAAPDEPAADMDAATYRLYVNFVNYYIHQVNLLRHLLGEPYHITYADPSGVLLAAQSASGVAGVIEMSPYRTTVDWQETALVAFERGYIQLDLPAPLASNRPGRVTIFRDPGAGAMPETTVPQLPWTHAMRQQALNFIRAIRGEAPPPCAADEALEDLRVAREYIRLWKGV